jgi:hypothetical protein
MISLSRLRPLRSKKHVIILVGSVLVLISAGSYVLWSKQVWDAYQPTYTQWHQTLKTDIAALAEAPTASPDDRKAVLSSFERVTKQADVANQTLCQIHPAVAWQANIWHNLQAVRTDCATTVASAAKLGDPFQKVTTYIQDDNKLAAIITTAPQSSELADDAWEAQVTAWQKMTTDIESTSASAAFAPVKKLAVTQVTAVKDAWQAVITAHQAKDKAKYLAAQDSLAHALDGLSEITVMSEKELQPLTIELEKAISGVIDS